MSDKAREELANTLTEDIKSQWAVVIEGWQHECEIDHVDLKGTQPRPLMENYIYHMVRKAVANELEAV